MKFRNGIYNSIRSLTGGGYIAYPDIQADLFIGTVVNGNRIGPISAGNINSSTQEFASFWSGPYSSIADVNYFLPKVESLMAAAGISRRGQRDGGISVIAEKLIGPVRSSIISLPIIIVIPIMLVIQTPLTREFL
jgi:hypothetical protein